MIVGETPGEVYSEIEKILENEDLVYIKDPEEEDDLERIMKNSAGLGPLPELEELKVKGLEFEKIANTRKYYEVALGDYTVEMSVDIDQSDDGKWAMTDINSEDNGFAKFVKSYLQQI